MIIGKRFAWGHLGKTGGTATERLFQLFPELIVHADETVTNAKHDVFAARRADVKGKRLLLNLRRLPSWLLSFHQHKARWGVFPDYKPSPVPCADSIAASSAADEYLDGFLDDGRFKIHRWIRTEYLKSDFLAAISEFTDVPFHRRVAVRDLEMVNAMEYDHDVMGWFSQAQIKRMYRNNPLWASIEAEIYPDLAPWQLRPTPLRSPAIAA